MIPLLRNLPRRAPAIAPAIALALATICLAPPTLAQTLRFAGGRIDAFPGRPMLIPVIPQTSEPPPLVRLRLDDGREVDAELVGFEADPPSIDPRLPRLWLPEPRVWTAAAPSRGSDTARLWRLLVTPPSDAQGQGLWLEGRRIDLTWRPDPWTLAPANDPGAPWASPNPPEWRDDAIFAELCEIDRHTPTRRWRWKLATGRLAPEGPINAADAPRPIESPEQLERALERSPLDVRALEAYADSLESLWRLALARLWRADPGVAAQVRARLAAAVELAPGQIVPAYAPLAISTERLLQDLTEPGLSDDRLVSLARAWLADLPPALMWVVDDAGRPGLAPGEVRPTIAVVNMAPTPQAVLTAVDAGGFRPDLDAAQPRRAVVARPVVPAPAGRAPSFAAARVRVGADTKSIPLVPYPLPTSPPGLLVGPLQRDWTLDELQGAPASAAPPPDAITTALVHRDAGPEAPSADGWRLYVECLAPAPSPEDAVTIWLGPYQRPHTVARVTSEGRRTDPRSPDAQATWIDVSRAPDRWSFQIDVPPGAIDDSGVLRLAIERHDASGLRTAAPRRMLPWQTEPGRLAVDTKTWNGF
ncbi:MAG: hypothetical protein R3B57_04215 [Phycisphaerales bacterium]